MQSPGTSISGGSEDLASPHLVEIVTSEKSEVECSNNNKSRCTTSSIALVVPTTSNLLIFTMNESPGTSFSGGSGILHLHI